MSFLLNKIEEIISESCEFTVPFFPKSEVLQQILLDQKEYVEERFELLAPEYFPEADTLDFFWGEAIADTEESYLSDSEKKKISDFYVKELIYRYAEKIGSTVIEQAESTEEESCRKSLFIFISTLRLSLCFANIIFRLSCYSYIIKRNTKHLGKKIMIKREKGEQNNDEQSRNEGRDDGAG